MKKAKNYLIGFCIGVINSLIGACGGIITVAALKKEGMNQTEAHANAIAIILPLTIISAAFYLIKGYTTLDESFIYIPGGIVGAIVGGIILPKIPQKYLRKIFAVFMLWAGIRMIVK